MSVKGDWMPLKGRGFRLKTASAPEAAVSTTVEQGALSAPLKCSYDYRFNAGKASRPLTQGFPIPSRLAISS